MLHCIAPTTGLQVSWATSGLCGFLRYAEVYPTRSRLDKETREPIIGSLPSLQGALLTLHSAFCRFLMNLRQKANSSDANFKRFCFRSVLRVLNSVHYFTHLHSDKVPLTMTHYPH